LTENRARIASDIEEGWTEAQAGELFRAKRFAPECNRLRRLEEKAPPVLELL
jgi:hypothetical protein